MRKFGEVVGLFGQIHSLYDISWDTLEWQRVEREIWKSSVRYRVYSVMKR